MSPDAAPALTAYARPRRPRAAVLVLHGGQEQGLEAVDRRNGSWLRAAVLARAVAPSLRREEVAVHLLRYRHRGWNGDGDGPVDDARWALDRLRDAHGDLPVVLLGHSMGARTAARVADDPSVTGVVALAPWFPPGEPVEALRGRRLHAAHGRGDRITSYAATESFVARAAGVAASAELTDMGDLGHYLLRGAVRWHRLAAEACLDLAVSDARRR